MTRASLVVGTLAATLVGGALTAQAPLVVRGGTVHTLAGDSILNGSVVIGDGKILAVGTDVALPEGAQVIDASGLHVYPGLFDAVSRLGLTEIGQVAVTQDMNELGEFNPHLLAAAAVHPASELIAVARTDGVTHASAAPEARPGGIGGQATVMHLDGWTIEEMQIEPSVGFMVAWPRLRGGFGGFGGFSGQPRRSYQERKRQRDERVRQLADWLESARRYDAAVKAGQTVPRDLKLEALARATRRELPLLVSVDDEQEIRDAVAFADSQQVRIVILGGAQAYKVDSLLAAKHVPVVLGQTQSTPTGDDEGYDERYAAPGLLSRAGVQFAIATFDASDSRTLPYQAGSAVSFGLPHDEALKAITLYPAQILGVDDRLGTIEEGKLANLIVTNGDPLEITTQVRHVVIAGREVSLDNKQLELYTRYRARPRP